MDKLEDYVGKEFIYLGVDFFGAYMDEMQHTLIGEYSHDGQIKKHYFFKSHLDGFKSQYKDCSVIRENIYNIADYVQSRLNKEYRPTILNLLNNIGVECNKLEGIEDE